MLMMCERSWVKDPASMSQRGKTSAESFHQQALGKRENRNYPIGIAMNGTQPGIRNYPG
jgi:hypothetical protein